jgi:hypothetical protein
VDSTYPLLPVVSGRLVRLAVFSSHLRIGAAALPARALSHRKHLYARLSSTGSKSAPKNEGADIYLKNQFSSARPLPTPPPSSKGMPPTISTHDVEEYVQLLYSRGWGLSPILPNGNGIAVLRKRFEFGSAKALKEFLEDLSSTRRKSRYVFIPFSSTVPTRI